MVTKNRHEKLAPARRTKPLRRIGIIAAVIVILLAAGIYIESVVNQTIADQQTQAALQKKPLTGVTTIEIVGMQFTPANIQVKVGTTVTWINKDNVAHTVTFKNGMKDSGLIASGTSYHYMFTRPGTFIYYCTVHPDMVAQVIVTS